MMFRRRKKSSRKRRGAFRKIKWVLLIVPVLLIAAFFYSRFQLREQFEKEITQYRWYLPADVLKGRRLVIEGKRFWLLDRSGDVFDNGRVRLDKRKTTLHLLSPLTEGTFKFHWGSQPKVAARYTTRFTPEIVTHGQMRKGKEIDNDDVKVPKGRSPQEAARYGDLASVKHFLDQGWPIDDKTKAWTTMLGMSAHYAHTEVVDWLLEKGADVNAVSNDGKPVLILAAETGHVPTILSLLKADNINKAIVDLDDNNALTIAVKFGHVTMVELLQEYDFDLKQKDENGQNLLHIALSRRDSSTMAYMGNNNMIRFLLKQGLDPKALDEDGVSAIKLADQQGQTGALLLLTGNTK